MINILHFGILSVIFIILTNQTFKIKDKYFLQHIIVLERLFQDLSYAAP